MRFVLIGLVLVAVGVVVGWVAGRTVFALKADDPTDPPYLIGRHGRSRPSSCSFAMFRLVFGPTGYFSRWTAWTTTGRRTASART